MSGGIDAASGGLLARAAEPAAGEPAGHAAGACLNCGTVLVDQFCHHCGQPAHIHRTLGSIGHDLLHGVFHFEGKIFRTLPLLVLRPGQLTRRYIAGERARFVSPLALFLFTVFLMFASFNLPRAGEGEGEGEPARQRAAMVDLNRQIATAEAELKLAQAGRSGSTQSEDEVAARSRLYSLRTARQAIVFTGGDGFAELRTVHTGWHALDAGLAKAADNPSLVLYKLRSGAYKYSWMLILLSTPFVALLFLWRSGYRLYDHAIFVTYSISFMSLLMIVLELCLSLRLPNVIFSLLLLCVPPAHMFVQLRGAYGLRVFGAAWRTVALLVFASVVLVLFIALLLALGLMH